MATNEQRRKVITELLEATFAKDFDKIGSLLTEDFTIWMAPSARRHGLPVPMEGRDKFLNFSRNIKEIKGMWRPRSYEIRRIYFDGDHAALWVHFEGDFEGGAPYENDYVFTFVFVGDKIAEKREFVDTVYIDQQRGAARQAS